MKIVIDIPDKKYHAILNHAKEILDPFSFIEPQYLYLAVINGTPLPKGHKIIDATAFVAHTDTGGSDEWDDYACYLVDKEPAIIGSESEE